MILPQLALSIRQPWSWLIVTGWKDLENRDWRTTFRGPVLIHAGKQLDKDAAADVAKGFSPCDGQPIWDPPPDAPETYRLGGIVGVAELVDCVTRHDSRWFVGPYAFVIANARSIDFIPCAGALGFFEPDIVGGGRPKFGRGSR